MYYFLRRWRRMQAESRVIQFFNKHKPGLKVVKVDPDVVCGGIRHYINTSDGRWYLVKEGDWGKYEFRGECDMDGHKDTWATLVTLNDLIPR